VLERLASMAGGEKWQRNLKIGRSKFIFICRLYHIYLEYPEKVNGKLLNTKWKFSKIAKYIIKHRNQKPSYRKQQLVGKNNERPHLQYQ